jgi:hypothetical protein
MGDRLDTPAAIPPHRLQAIQVASFWLNWLGQCNVRDTQCGFRLYPARLLKQLRLKHGGFLLESEILLKTRQAGYTIHTVPIRALYPAGHHSHYRPFQDGVVIALYLLYRGLCFWPVQLWQLFATHRHAYVAPRRQEWRKTQVACLATLLLPLLFLALCLQLLLRQYNYNILTPIIRMFYASHLLHRPPNSREKPYAKHCYHRSATL